MPHKISKINGIVLFRETQQFRQGWFWLLLVSPILATLIISIITMRMVDTNTNELLAALSIAIPLNLLMMYLFYIARFETAVGEEGFCYRWAPFYKKYHCIPRTEIKKIELRRAPLMQYGYRWSPCYGQVHNLTNGKGLQFTLRSGKRIFIGSQKINQLENAVSQLIPVNESKKLKRVG